MKSIHKAQNLARTLKDRLSLQGLSLSESTSAAGWPKLSLGTVASIEIAAVDAVSKDIFGNQEFAYAPHIAHFAVVSGNATPANNISNVDLAKIVADIAKAGLTISFKESAVDLATAEAAQGTIIEFDAQWPTKSM
ncbi:MAG: hypothetical protein D6707_06720 [Bacteroidetes bacterium]|nr:MAG: hypothetical protein D6707_06720 [Bacteroidota bacterium]